jgi:hypothetical protein
MKFLTMVLSFIKDNFRRMPSSVQTITYLLVVLVFVLVVFKGVMSENILLGQMWVIDSDGVQREGEGYNVSIHSGERSFITNKRGRWALSTGAGFPIRSVKACLKDADDHFLGNFEISLPLPVVSHLTEEGQHAFVYDERTHEIRNAGNSGFRLVGEAYAQPPRGKALYVKIKKITLKESGDSKDTRGELYFKARVDGEKLKLPTGFPQKGVPDSYLLIDDDSTTVFNDLKFRIADVDPESFTFDLVLELLDNDPYIMFFSSPDDRVGIYKKQLTEADLAMDIELFTDKIEKSRDDNSSVVIELMVK